MTTTLITGTNEGLGFEAARQLIDAGHTVYIGSRDPLRGQRAADTLGALMVPLDMTDDESVNAAARFIDGNGGLDVLVNNAGIERRGENNTIIAASAVTADLVREIFDTNVFGAVRVIHAFLPLLAQSPAPVMVNVSSSLGSLNLAASRDRDKNPYPGIAYPASKIALNMITLQFAKQFPTMRINAVGPGYTDTDLNGHTGTQKPSKRAHGSS